VDNVEAQERRLLDDPANRKLTTEWARNKFLIRLIAGVGWLVPREGGNGRPAGGTIADPVGVAKAERDAQLDILRRRLSPTDPDRHRLFDAVWDEYYRRMDALRQATAEDEWKKAYWAEIEQDLDREIAAQTKVIDDMEVRLGAMRAELRALEESDGRSAHERAAKEPPHPPYAKIQQARQEVLRLQDDLAAEKRFRQALEEDATRLKTLRPAMDVVDDPARGPQ
jgi:hypothetical protein